MSESVEPPSGWTCALPTEPTVLYFVHQYYLPSFVGEMITIDIPKRNVKDPVLETITSTMQGKKLCQFCWTNRRQRNIKPIHQRRHNECKKGFDWLFRKLWIQNLTVTLGLKKCVIAIRTHLKMNIGNCFNIYLFSTTQAIYRNISEFKTYLNI